MNFKTSVFRAVLAASASLAFGQDQDGSRELKLQPVFVSCDAKRAGMGTIVSDASGRYIVTARHLIATKAAYTTSSDAEGKLGEKLYISRVGGDERSELIIGLLSVEPVVLDALPSRLFIDMAKHLLETNEHATPITIMSAERILTPTNERVNAIASWEPFRAQKIEYLRADLGPGSSGAGVISTESRDTFWIVTSGVPQVLLERMRKIAKAPGARDLTMVCGATWAEIEAERQKLLRNP